MSVEKHIIDYVRQADLESLVRGDGNAYQECRKQIQSVVLGSITEVQVREIVERFLLEWGWMRRVIRAPNRIGWQKQLAAKIRDLCAPLTNYREVDLNGQVLTPHKTTIIECYDSFRPIVGPTSAAKVLHLLAPNFFPPWDETIRDLAWMFPRSNADQKKGQKRSSGGEYYFFMLEYQHFLNTYVGAWDQLSAEFRQTSVKIIDSYLWQNGRPLAWFDCCESA